MHVDPNEALPAGRSRETRIRRDARGRWWNGEDEITHPLLVRAFDAWIERTDDGRYCLKNDINWAYVTIEGAPIDVRACRLERAADRVVACQLVLSDGREETLDVGTLRESKSDGVLYCDVRGGTMPARFDAHAAMQLEDALVESEQGAAIRIGDRAIVPPRVGDPLRMPG
ncbi:MAG: DUF1285 domain-containing protein [Sandaracinus sp.]